MKGTSFKINTMDIIDRVRTTVTAEVNQLPVNRQSEIGPGQRVRIHPHNRLRGLAEQFADQYGSPSRLQLREAEVQRQQKLMATENETGPDFLSKAEVARIERRFGSLAAPLIEAYEFLANKARSRIAR